MKKVKLYPDDIPVQWDDIEINPVKEISKNCFEQCEPGQEDLWSVYLHKIDGGVSCVADARTKEDAIKIADFILQVLLTFKNNGNIKGYPKV